MGSRETTAEYPERVAMTIAGKVNSGRWSLVVSRRQNTMCRRFHGDDRLLMLIKVLASPFELTSMH
jgi:hypothetical protein